MAIAVIYMTLGGSVLLFLALLIASVAAGIFFYRFTVPPLPTGFRILLASLRSVSLSLLILILFTPTVRLVKKNLQPPVIAVLVDGSASMKIADGRVRWDSLVKELLEKNHFNKISSDVKPEYFLFSSGLKPSSDRIADSLSTEGETTDLSNAVSELRERIQSENIQASALITDGNYNTGRNPLYEAEAAGIPVYTIGVGDTNERKDVLVKKIVANDLAYAGTRAPVDVVIKSSGGGGENVEVTLAEGSAVLDRKVLTLREGTREYRLKMTAELNEEETKKFTVAVSRIPGELTEKNNAQTFFVKVMRSRKRVLIIAGAPGPDVSAVRQALLEDRRLSVSSLVQKRSGEFYERHIDGSLLDSADCFVLIGFPSSASGGQEIASVVSAIENLNKPLLFINGSGTDYSRLKSFDTVLPFRWKAPDAGEILVTPLVAENQKMHSLVALQGEISADEWQQLPPVYKSKTVFEAKPGTVALSFVKTENLTTGEPMMLTRNVNRQKSIALTCHGIWRWRLMTQGNPRTGKFLPLLLSNALLWLTAIENEKNVRVAPVKETFTTNEDVEFTGQVYDDRLAPVGNAEIIVEISRGTEKFQIALDPAGEGLYSGSAGGAGEGDYTYTAKASADGKNYGEDKGKFSVGRMNLEYLETKMNKPLLEQIAYRTKGRYYDIAGAGRISDDMADDLKFSAKEIFKTSEIELWSWEYLAGIIIFLFAAEWILRKRWGMV